MRDKKWYIGCSGFHYKEWKNSFYPEGLPQRKWFDFYCSKFNTIELNVTFYRFPRVEFLKNWFDKSPDDFIFSVKVPRLITHYKRLNDCERLLNDFYTTCSEGLGKKLGAVLFQFPSLFNYTEKNVALLAGAVQKGFTNVAEFRDKSWWNDEAYKTLNKCGVSFCGISHPSLPETPIVNTKTVYYRFHGVPKLYYSGYDQRTLNKIITALSANKNWKNAFIYFNNTAAVSAIENALWVKQQTQLKHEIRTRQRL